MYFYPTVQISMERETVKITLQSLIFERTGHVRLSRSYVYSEAINGLDVKDMVRSSVQSAGRRLVDDIREYGGVGPWAVPEQKVDEAWREYGWRRI
jgi:hypothetical protein